MYMLVVTDTTDEKAARISNCMWRFVGGNCLLTRVDDEPWAQCERRLIKTFRFNWPKRHCVVSVRYALIKCDRNCQSRVRTQLSRSEWIMAIKWWLVRVRMSRHKCVGIAICWARAKTKWKNCPIEFGLPSMWLPFSTFAWAPTIGLKPPRYISQKIYCDLKPNHSDHEQHPDILPNWSIARGLH